MSSKRLRFYSADAEKVINHWGSNRHEDGKYYFGAVILAVGAGRVSVLKWLFAQGMLDVLSEDVFGRTIARFAALHGQVDVLEYLDSRGLFDPTNSNPNSGKNVAHLASEMGSLTVLKWLHSRAMFDAKCKDVAGQNVAHLAAENGQLAVLQWLHSLGLLSIANEKTKYGKDALALSSNSKVFDWLNRH